MSGRTPLWLTVIAVCLLACLTGCVKQTNLTLNFAPEDTTTYKVSTQMIKDFRFEQPSLKKPKLQEEQSGTTVDITFEQKVDKVEESDGSALATVTIKEVVYVAKDKDAVKFDFDSTRQADKDKPFAKVIGQSYTIKISPDGVAKAVDAKDARKAVTAGYEGEVAKALFSNDRIKKRHSILALPDIAKSTLKAGSSWSRIVTPRDLLAPKSFEKTYTLESIEGPKGNRVATILMNAAESAEPAPDTGKQFAGMGILAKMFDATETYTGKMVLELGTGKILQYNEELVATYLAAEEPRGGSGDKGPDTLTMRLTQSTRMEIVE